jgi:hypothetical protein
MSQTQIFLGQEGHILCYILILMALKRRIFRYSKLRRSQYLIVRYFVNTIVSKEIAIVAGSVYVHRTKQIRQFTSF